jgi:flagellar hook-associated protein 2
MATISSPGIGSGLDIKSIVSQLVALEKAPLQQLDIKSATIQTRISAFGQIKSLVSPLSDAASKLNSLTTWNAVATSSSNTKAVSATAIGGTAATTFSVEVQALAKPQDTASASILPVGSAVGAGTLRLTAGVWTPPAGITPASFAPGTATPVDITVTATDKLTDIASKINGSGAGVTATVLTDASGERLLLRSKSTGEVGGFQLSVPTDADGNPNDAAGLSRTVVGTTFTQYGADAEATINGIPVTSSTNTFANVVSGVSLTVGEVTSSAVTVGVTKDMSAITGAIDAFVKAYNTLNESLNELTKYDPSNKSAGILQGDSTAVGLQTALRGVLQSGTVGSAFSRLADIGVTQQLGGNLAVNSTKLNAALDTQLEDVKSLFRADNGNPLTNGVTQKFKAFTAGLLATDGFFTSKDASLKRSLDATAKDKVRVNEKVARVEAALNRRYSALDAQVASLSALNAYVSQQVTTWNKSKS